MIKVFTTNKDGKIELTKDELKALLDEAYWDGYRANTTTYVYHTPSWSPYQWNATSATVSNAANTKVTLTSNGATDHTDCYTGQINTDNVIDANNCTTGATTVTMDAVTQKL